MRIETLDADHGASRISVTQRPVPAGKSPGKSGEARASLGLSPIEALTGGMAFSVWKEGEGREVIHI